MKRFLYSLALIALAFGAETSGARPRAAALTVPPAVAEMVGDLNPEAFSDSFSTSIILTPVGNWTYFAGSDRTHGTELWRTDGTPEGTTLVADIWPGPESSLPHSFTVSGETLYFLADDGAHGIELWVSDASGTVFLGDFEPGMRSYAPDVGALYPQQLTPFGAEDLLFTTYGGSRLWRASPGVAPVLIQQAKADYQHKILAADPAGGLFFFGSSSLNQNTEAALWVSDGTPAGTHLIHAFTPAPGHTYEFLEGLMLNGRLVFKLSGSASGGTEVWTSDGSDPGTQAIYSSTMPYYITSTRIDSLGKIFFTAGSYGGELWVTDGSAAGTLYLASDLYNIKNISDVNGRALFISYL